MPDWVVIGNKPAACKIVVACTMPEWTKMHVACAVIGLVRNMYKYYIGEDRH